MKTTKGHYFIRKLVCFAIAVLTLVGPAIVTGTPGLLCMTASATDYAYTYYAKYTGKSSSLVDALKAMGIDSSYSNRTSIAVLNGYSNYTGTAAQNTALLKKLKNGTLIKSKTAVSSSNDWAISMTDSITIKQGQSASVTVQFRGTGISSFSNSVSNSGVVSTGFSNTSWKSAGQWCSTTLNISAKSVGTTTITFRLNGTCTASKQIKVTVTSSNTASTSIVDSNLSKTSWIKQGSQTCKASSLAMALNLLTGKAAYSTSSLGSSCCTNINGKSYTGSNGAVYVATYKTDSYVGSASEQKNAVEAAVAQGLPIVVAVHSTVSGKTAHHWVVIVGKSGNDYLVVDPSYGSSGSMKNNVKTMSSLKYEFGLTDYSTPHYGYISFSKK